MGVFIGIALALALVIAVAYFTTVHGIPFDKDD